METPTANYLQIMKTKITALREKGDLNEVLSAINEIIEKCQQVLGTEAGVMDTFVDALEERAKILLGMERYEEAVIDTKDAIAYLRERPDKLDQLGRLSALLGAAYDGLGRPDRVIEAWEQGVSYFEQHEPPLLMDVATILNNLGFTAKAKGDLDGAEDYFLRSLQIMYEVAGPKDAETASVSSNLGTVYLEAGYLDRAREMQMMALETRREIFGEEHPDTAQSHNNLAMVLLKTGDLTWARRHFERALTGFEALGSEYADDLEMVAENYCDFLRHVGEESMSEIIAGRVQELLESIRE